MESLYLPILVIILFFRIFGGGKDARGGGMQAAGGSLGFYHRSELQSLQSLPTHAAKILNHFFFLPLTLGRACQGPSAHSARNSDARSRRLNSGDGSESRTWNPGKLLFGLLSRLLFGLLFGLGQGIPTRTHAARRRL